MIFGLLLWLFYRIVPFHHVFTYQKALACQKRKITRAAIADDETMKKY